jgi:hypothetical protein
MNDILKNILLISEKVAAASLPGGAIIDNAVRNIIDSKGKNPDAIGDLSLGVIQSMEGFKKEDIADEVQFRAGVMVLQTGFKMIHDSLKKPVVNPVTAPVVNPTA